VLDACVDLWTARRIAARAVSRLPEVPEWNDDGLRMELVR
jgi:predicted RNase H-like nuclease